MGTLSWWSCQSPVAHSCGPLDHLNTFCGGMFKLKAKFDADLLLYFLSHFECDIHTIHMQSTASTTPTDQYSEVVIVQACSFQSTLLGCQVASMSCKPFLYINNGCTFSRQTSYIHVYVYNIRNIYYQGIIGKFFRYNNVIVLYPHPFRGTNLDIYKMGEKAGNGKEDEKKWVGIHSP